MINKIIDGISLALNAEFGDDYTIYTESVEQGLAEPCFTISCLSPSTELFRGRKYSKKNLFCVQYFPSSSEERNESMEATDRLFECLEYIYVEKDLQRGMNMHAEFVDGVLNFFVNYDLFTYRDEDNEEMETMTQKTEVGQ